MKAAILALLLVPALLAHDFEGRVTRGDVSADIPRLPIPFSAFSRVEGGRIFEHWIGETTVLLVFVQEPREARRTKGTLPNPSIRVWCVEAPERLRLPAGLREASLNSKDSISGVEEFHGSFDLTWKGDADYSLSLDIQAEKQKFLFVGHLFGGPNNKKKQNEN